MNKKTISWYTTLLIYCLENGSKRITKDEIAKSLNMSTKEYNNSVSFLKKSGAYNIARRYVNEVNNIYVQEV